MTRRVRLEVVLFVGAQALAVGLPSGCASGTGSKRFDFDASVGGLADIGPGPFTFTNQRGWTITLTRADVTLGPVYLNVIPPLRDPTFGLLDLVIKRAWAAGESHLAAGRVVGEVLGQVKFSAISSTLIPLPVRGSMAQEQVRTADVWFAPAPSASCGDVSTGSGCSQESASSDTVALDVSGEATRAGTTVRFRGALKMDSTWIDDVPVGTPGRLSLAESRQVRGIPASFFPDQGGRLEIRVDVTRLFRGADFSTLDANPAGPDGTKQLVQGKVGNLSTDQVMTNLHQGIQDVEGTYAVRWIDR